MTPADVPSHDAAGPTRERRAARIIMLAPDMRVLLFRVGVGYLTAPAGIETREGFWALPGGGVDPGETFEAAALRELREETGHVPPPGLPCIAKRSSTYPWNGQRWRSIEEIFFFRAESNSVATEGWTASDKRWIHSLRWFGLEELSLIKDPIRPPRLAELCRRLAAGDLPSPPIVL